MIFYLHIKNFGLFEDQEVQFEPGLTVFTGETGAGKSMVIDAVMAAMGHRISSEVIRAGQDRALVELLINLEDYGERLSGLDALGPDIPAEIVFSRDILPERSYIRINGRISTMTAAQEISGRLVDIHGQQEHHSLLRPDSYVTTLDSMRKDVTGPLVQRFHSLYLKRQEIIGQMQELSRDESQRKREIDLLEFQVNEIEGAKLKQGEEESLRQEFRVLSSQGKILAMVEEVKQYLYQGQGKSAFELLGASISLLKKISAMDQRVQPALKSLEETSYNLEVTLDLLKDYERNLEVDPSRLKEVEERLDLLERLKSKYGRTVEDILAYKEDAVKRLEVLARSKEILEGLKAEKARIEEELKKDGVALSRVRKEIGDYIEEYLQTVLGELGMPGARFIVSMENEEDPSGIMVNGRTVRPFPDGLDRVSFLFSANPGEPPQPLYKVASGGELSRLMLALKSCMAQSDPVPTLIFDEIDAGVGGKAGQAIALKLWELGRHHQVIVVTHLASIAAMADNHFVVTKEEKNGRTVAHVKKVDGNERVREIARMLSGEDADISLEHASSMLEKARSLKNL